ncbi:unnamed protein product [Dicrocoelium dendriticum]|nr:unnamed protein product [Dicrocoelium dendriticum]
MRTHEPHDSALPVIVLTKGAETALLARVASDVSDFHQDAVLNDPLVAGLSSPTRQLLRMHPDEVMKRVTAFANSGLRTLVMGARVLSPEQWYEYKSTLDAAKGQLEGRDDAISKAYGQIESQLVLIGCTGVEDMLQDGVAETITALHDAGLKVWVLTGDKEETAVNISYAAGHFNPEMKEIRITKQTNCIDCNNALDKHIAKMAEARVADLEDQFAAVIDGQSLGFALDLCPLCPWVLTLLAGYPGFTLRS